MMVNILYFFLVMTIACLQLPGCISTKFAPTESSPQNLSPYGDKSIYTITCQAERGEKSPISLPGKAAKYVYRVSPSCDQQKVEVSEDFANKPMNVVIVLDRTGSMEASISGVKNGIFDVAQQLEKNGWDAHFAAVGFRDYPNDFIITPFVSARTLISYLEKWRAEGGDDPQEAGQLAIETAADLLENYQRSKPLRKNSLNVILYASDSVAYAGQDHNDFTVQELTTAAQDWKLTLGDIRFYFSVPDNIDPLKEWGLDAPTPVAQLKEFIQKSDLQGRGFGFPLTPAILNEFAKEFVKVTVTEPLVCSADSALLESTTGSGISERDEKISILDLLTNGKALEFKTSPDPNVKDYRLEIRRCCRPRNADSGNSACKSVEKIPFEFMFSQPIKK